ncbi:MAG TPA: M48 family metallopeptidase [Spirochaetota bacterium]|nr:M48 family metallopeptidase [Spirochaetota bacterium]
MKQPQADDTPQLSGEKAKRYNRIKIRVTITDMAAGIIFIAFLAFSGISQWLVIRITDAGVSGDYYIFLLFLAVLGTANGIIGLPLDFYSSYIIEHRYGLSNQTIPAWTAERLKSLGVGLAIGVPVSLLFFFLIRTAGHYWWVIFSGAVFLFAVIMARVAPVLIFPLFYTFKPLEESELREKINTLMRRYSIPIQGIFSFNLSKDTKKANAGFTGIGKSKRVILSDTLMEQFTTSEIMVIFAHELGHYLKRHIVKNVIMSGVIIFLSFYVCSGLYDWTRGIYGFQKPDDIAALPILLFYLTVTGLIIMPLTNALSRKYEREADRFAVTLTDDPDSFISGMEKLADRNLSDKNPHPLVEFLLYSHPSIGKRIQFAERLKEQ